MTFQYSAKSEKRKAKSLFFITSVLGLSILLIPLNLPAQNPYIHQYTTNDGLPSNTVYYIFQDSKKFIWFATDAGVSRYDGTSFTNYWKKDGLSSNEVIRIKEDSLGRIWFFNLNSRLNFFYQNRIFNETNAPFLDSIKNKNFFIDFYEDQSRVIYFYTRWYEIFSIDAQNKVKKYEIDESILNDLSFGDCRYLSKNATGDFIIWMHRGVFKLSNAFRNPRKIYDSVPIWNVFPGPKKSFYLSAYGHGVYKVTGEFQIKNTSTLIKISLTHGSIKSILEDADGFLWIVTYDKGVFCVRENKIESHLDIKEGQAIIQDNENNIWISSMKDGVYKISSYLYAHRHYENSLFGNTGITAMDAKPGTGLWFTNGNLIYLLKNNVFFTFCYQGKKMPFNHVSQLKNGTLIVGASSSFAFKGITMHRATKRITYKTMTESQYKSSKIGLNAREDKMNGFGGTALTIYKLGTPFKEEKMINCGERIFNTFYNLNDDLIINAKKNYVYQDEKLLPCIELSLFDTKIITDHLIMNDSIELFNIEGDSIYLHDRQRFYNLTAAFNTPIDLKIRKIISHGPTLYLSTFRNIYKCDNPVNSIANKTLELQLLDINFRNIKDILVNNDSLYIASDDGLTIIPEALIGKITTHTPVPYIQSILINDKKMDPLDQELILRGNNKITFNFSSINYSSTPILYSYKMEGMDTAWTIGTSRNVVYQNLGRGKYIFLLRVRKSSADWSQPVENKIRIIAVWWQHPLFFIVLSVILMGLLILIIIRRKNIQIKRRELDHQLITLEQKALQSMMNPHFIFNSLGSIQNYLLQKKSGEAGLYLSQFARLIRQNLNAINASSINLEEEVDRLKNYLDLEKMRMDNKFEYRIEVDENLESDEIRIPSMIVQPFVENAVWHGIATMKVPGVIAVKFRMQDEKSVMVLIEDNGIGIKRSETCATGSEKHLHLGMEMTRKRLEILGKKYSVKTRIEFSEMLPGNPNPGTRVEMVVPVET